MAFADAMLKSYVAGDLGEPERERIEAALANDPALEKRLMAFDGMAAHVRAAMRDLPDATRIERLSIATAPAGAPRAAARRGWVGLAAACIIGIVIGWGGTQIVPGADVDWRTEVAHYQALYTQDTIAAIPTDAAALSAQLANASAVVGTELQAADLRAFADMRLLRAQVLGFSGEPLVQIVFEGPGGTPVALCLIRTGAGEDAMRIDDMLGLASASWANGGIEYLLIGGQDNAWIEDRAAEMRARLDARI
ncbi:MAG: hypothetical protein AAF367_12520 [Pseudomonadota bacterium]